MSPSFQKDFPNQLLVNPKLSLVEKNYFEDLKKEFEKNNSSKNFFLIASSGSSQKSNEGAKLIALSLQSILNSAHRFNLYFSTRPENSWGLVLPTFHVAGLSTWARAFHVGAQVFSFDWRPSQIQANLLQDQISFLSLVPAQVYDLVQLKVRAPECVKKIFVGAGLLNEKIRQAFIDLGWPLVETYGMTETCSMIAVKQNEQLFQVLPGVQVKTENQYLQIRCNSLAHSSYQKKSDQIFVQHFDQQSWLATQDQVTLSQRNQKAYLQFLGRQDEYIKILGEGVSLRELRDRLEQILIDQHLNPKQAYLVAVDDLRLQNRLVLIVEKCVDRLLADRLVQQFNLLVRPYEKIQNLIQVESIPRTDLGKVKIQDLLKSVKV